MGDTARQSIDHHSFAQISRLDMYHILYLDNQSTVDIFYNLDLLCNIRNTPTNMKITTNSGGLQTSTMGTLRKYEELCNHEGAMTKIIIIINLVNKAMEYFMTKM